MAISQVTKGVFVVSPDQQKRYKDTAAGEYTSVFTKNRADQWELAQKQALMEMNLSAKAFELQADLYQRRNTDIDNRVQAMQTAIDRAKGDNAALAQAAKIATEKERLDVAKAKASREEAQAATMPLARGGGSSTTVKDERTTTKPGYTVKSTGGSGDSGGKVGTADATEIGGAVRASGGSAAAAVQDLEKRKAAGTVTSTTGEDAIAVNAALVTAIIEDRVTADKDRDTAEKEVLTELANAKQNQYIDDFSNDTRKKETGGGPRSTTYPTVVTTTPLTKSTTTRTGGGSEQVNKYPGLKDFDFEAVPITAEVIDIATMEKQRDAIEAERNGLAPPQVPDMDYINRARGIAATRFGPTRQSPAYAQRAALGYLSSAPADVVKAAYDQYMSSQAVPPASSFAEPAESASQPLAPSAKQAPEPRDRRNRREKPISVPESLIGAGLLGAGPGPATLLNTPVPKSDWDSLAPPNVPESDAARMFRLRGTMAGASAAEPVAYERGNIPPPPDIGEKPEEPEVEKKRRSLGDYLLRGFKPELDRQTGDLNLSGQEYVTAVQGVGDQSPGRQARLFPNTMSPPYPREVNGRSFRPVSYNEMRGDPAGEAFLDQNFLELEGISDTAPQYNQQLYRPPTPAVQQSTMTAPVGQVEPIQYTPRARPGDVSLGEKPEGALGPSTEPQFMQQPAERGPLTAGRTGPPFGATRRADAAIEATKRVSDVKAATKAGLGGETLGISAKKDPTAEVYLFNRMAAAVELSKQEQKLKRLIASGPGKIANDLYVADKSKGVSWNKTWSEITMTFANDKEAMAKAHEVMLALSMKSDDQTTPKE